MFSRPESAEHTLAQLPAYPMHVVFVSALPPFAIIHARSLCRKIRQKYPDLKIVLGLWNSAIPAETVKQRLGSACSDYIVTTLEQAQSRLARPAYNRARTKELRVTPGATMNYTIRMVMPPSMVAFRP